METKTKTRFLLLPDISVAERIKEFRVKHPDWKILPEVIEVAPDWIVMKAVIKNEEKEIQKMNHAS